MCAVIEVADGHVRRTAEIWRVLL